MNHYLPLEREKEKVYYTGNARMLYIILCFGWSVARILCSQQNEVFQGEKNADKGLRKNC